MVSSIPLSHPTSVSSSESPSPRHSVFTASTSVFTAPTSRPRCSRNREASRAPRPRLRPLHLPATTAEGGSDETARGCFFRAVATHQAPSRRLRDVARVSTKTPRRDGRRGRRGRRSRDAGNARGSGGWVRGRASPGVPRARVGVEAMDDGEARLAVSPASGASGSGERRAETGPSVCCFEGRSHLNPRGMSPSSIASSFLFADVSGAPLCSRGRSCRTGSACTRTRGRRGLSPRGTRGCAPTRRRAAAGASSASRSRGAFARASAGGASAGRARWPPPPSRGPRRGVRQHPPGAVDERSHGRRGSGRRWRGRAPPSRKPRGRIIFARRPRQQRSAHDVES